MKNRFLLIFLIFGVFLISSAEDINIGIIYGNFPQEIKNNMNENLKTELDKNFENTQFNPVIKKGITRENREIMTDISKFEKDESIDVTVVMNQNPSELIRGDKGFKKLVIAPFFYGIHSEGQTENINAISTDYNLKEVINTLNEIREIKTVGILFSHEFLETARTYKNRIVEEKLLENESVVLISLDEEEESMSVISGLDALMVVSDTSKPLKKIMEKASQEGIPSFSFFFSEEDSSDVLMGYSQKIDAQRRIRVAVTNLLKYYEKREFSELTSTLDSDSLNIMVDYEVAEAADIYPGGFSSEKIRVINEKKIGDIDLTIKDALERLLENNTDIRSKKEEVISDSYNVKIAKSGARPNFSATMDYEKNDGSRAENSLKGGFTISQVLYNEEVFSNVSIQKNLYDAVKEELRQKETDQIQNLLTVYLNTLKSYTDFEIEEYNSNLVKRYLNVAKTKYSVGSSGPEDVYRFESELASSTTNLEGIRSNIFSGNSDLNRLLNTSMDNYFSIHEKGIEEIIDLSIFENFSIELNKPWKMTGVKNYFIQKGIENSPELKNLDFQIEAKERELKAAKRRRYLPKVTANVNYDKDLRDPWGEGTYNTEADQYWTAGVGFILPIYSGGEIEYTKNQVKSELKKLELDRETETSEISKDISSQYGRILANYRKIKSAEKSVEASRKNLKLQEDMYVKGRITITDMIDARNNLIKAEQTAASVKFDYYISMADMEKLCGKYYFEYSDEEKRKTEVFLMSLSSSDQGVR